MSSATDQETHGGVSTASLNYAAELAAYSGRRRQVPVRNSFVRNDDPDELPPLARLLRRGGRGGAVPIKLYISLIWRCSAPPFDTEISARKWAVLLDLPDPNSLGARRITTALETLNDENLVNLEKRRGDSTTVTLREESGLGIKYSLPSTKYKKTKDEDEKRHHQYFKVPFALWTDGHIQQMSAPALAMLLILLAERNRDGRPTWWSTELFPARFNIAESARSKGTRELVERDLLFVGRQSVSLSRNPSRTFVKERVRNTYTLIGDASIGADED